MTGLFEVKFKDYQRELTGRFYEGKEICLLVELKIGKYLELDLHLYGISNIQQCNA
jgi:hypothetical protein